LDRDRFDIEPVGSTDLQGVGPVEISMVLAR
jgi:hypothetical protein